jgi:hypothetical protein
MVLLGSETLLVLLLLLLLELFIALFTEAPALDQRCFVIILAC